MSTESQVSQRCLIAFATGWGSEFGGINVFNTEFLQHLSFACQGRLSVVCVVPTAPPEKVQHAQDRGVTLVELPYPPVDGKLDASHAWPAIQELSVKQLLSQPDQLVWLGHDRITGAVALEARDVAGGRAALIHHMSYAHYEAYAESATSASSKLELQKSLFKRADLLWAIGPLLRDALQDMVDMPATMLVPGLDEIKPRSAPKTFIGFMSGRLSADTAKVKQSHLGVAAFADAQKRASADLALPDALRDEPRLILRGADLESLAVASTQPDARELNLFAETYAGRVVTLHALPYTTRREALLEELAGATVALMPSWHEGFGLVGWEAVAAGVPLVISKKSGLYRLINEESRGAWINWVYPVDVRGKVDEPFFHEEDLKAVSDRLLEIAKNPAAAREKAARLREALSSFDWKHCVDAALESLNWPNSHIETTVGLLPSPPDPLADSLATADSPEEASPLQIPRSLWRLGSGLADSQLLRAEEEAVPFDPAREPELSKLLQWATDAEFSQALRLITGSGGSGKTRLALELCAHLQNEGWHSGFFPSEIGATQVSGAWAELIAKTRPILAVFDYAETRQETLIAFIKAMLQTTSKPRLRILLLARDGGEWWDRLPALNSRCEPFLSGYATSGPFSLPPLHNDLNVRETAFQAALRAYAARIGIEDVPNIGVDLTGEHFARPLYVQMAALLALHGERPASAEGLTRALLHHERRYWTRLLQDPAGENGLAGITDRHAAELMTLATLAAGFTRPADAQQVWRAWASSAGRALDTLRQRTLFERLASLYPGQKGLQPLRPDLLGEALVAHALLQESGADLLEALLGPANHVARRQSVLSVIARLSNHRPDIEVTVVPSLTRTFVACAVDLWNVATQSDSRLPIWAERAFERLPGPVRNQVTGILLPMLEHESVQLGHLACAIFRSEVEKTKVKLNKKPGDTTVRASYARALGNYAVSLQRVGLDAFAPAQENTEIFQELAKRDADRFEADWANSLRNYSNALRDQGRLSEALACSHRSLRILEKLASDDPRKFEARWAGALSHYAATLSNNGQYNDALMCSSQALEVHERLTQENPERFEPGLAIELSNHSMYLSATGKATDALECSYKALAIQEKLATKNVDRFEPDWAKSLSNYGSQLSNNGRCAEGMAVSDKALTIYEKLVKKNVERFEPALARALRSHADHLSMNGWYAQGLKYSQEALEILRKLVKGNPIRFEEDFAAMLATQAIRLLEIGKYHVALESSRQALKITEDMAARQPLKFSEAAYQRLLFVSWLEWLTDMGTNSVEQELDLALCKPHRVPVLKVYRAVLDACYASSDHQRASAWADVLLIGTKLNVVEFRVIELDWLCASAWCATHAPEIVPQTAWKSRWLPQLRRFSEQRGGRFPAWMEEVAQRMGFEWPKQSVPQLR